MTAEPTLSIVIPAYNEAARIPETLRHTTGYAIARGLPTEVLVVDDGSRDGTSYVVEEVACRFPFVRLIRGNRNRGKGFATRKGILECSGRYVGYMDADYKTPIEELDRFLPVLEAGADVVIGSRSLTGAKIEVPQPLHRRLGSKAFAFALRRLIELDGVSDTQCGFKFFQRPVAVDLFSRLRTDGYMFDVEMLHLLMRLGYRLEQVPIRWQNDPDSRYHVVTGTLRNAAELLRIRTRIGRRVSGKDSA